MRLLISAQPGELRAAWVEDGRLVDLTVRRDDHPSRLGEIHLGRVAAVDRALGAAFVDLGLARPGFLPLSEVPGGRLVEGAAVTVRVLRDATGDKGPRLSAKLIDPPPDLVQLSHDARPPCRLVAGGDPLTRMLTMQAALEEVVVDHPETFQALKTRAATAAPELAGRMTLDFGAEPLFERTPLVDAARGDDGETVEAAIDGLLEPRVALPSGGVLWIEPTHGMVAIDVDSGRQSAQDPHALARGVNLEAAAEIPRQLRLRALSGRIVVDFLEPGGRAARDQVLAALRAGLKDDPEPGWIETASASGLVALTRRRAAPALHEILTTPCGAGGGGRRKTAETLAFEALRAVRRAAGQAAGAGLTLHARPTVLAALSGAEGVARPAREDLEKRLGRALSLDSGNLSPGWDYEVVAEG